MRSALWFLVGGILTLVVAGIFADRIFAGVLLVAGLGAIAGSLNAILGGLNDGGK